MSLIGDSIIKFYITLINNSRWGRQLIKLTSKAVQAKGKENNKINKVGVVRRNINCNYAKPN